MANETATVPPFDVEQTVLSQYANSPVTTSLIDYFSQWFDPTANLQSFYSVIWNILSAQGFGLDIWGNILRVSRYIPIPNQNYFGFAGNGWQPFNVAPFFIGGSTTNTFALPDAQYLTLLLAKAFANLARTSIQSLNALAQSVFGAGAMCVLDLGGMAMAYVFATTPSAVNLAIAESSGVFPHPNGVATTVRTALLYNAQLVAGSGGSDVGYISGSFGTLTPSVDVNGNTIYELYSSSGDIVLVIQSGTTLGSTYFNDLTLNGVSLAASAATFGSGGGLYTWTWSGALAASLAFTAGNTYTALIS